MSSIKIPIAVPCLDGKELEYVQDCIKSSWISSKGKYVTNFEEKFAEYVGGKYGVAVSNGTVALHLALAVLGIGKGDEAIIPTLTMIAAANAVHYTGAKSILADSESKTWNIDPQEIKKKITKITKGIIVVHLYGHPANMDPIVKIARDHNLYVIEDAAEAHGAKYKGRKVGVLGDIGCFSFYANKIITTGEGGMLVTNNGGIAERARKLRDQAYNMKMRNWLIHDEIGYNYRLTNMQAAIGLAQLERIDTFIKTHRENAHLYKTLLEGTPGITLPPEETWARNVYWMYTILVDENKFGISRDKIMFELERYGVETRSVFYPIHFQPPYRSKFRMEKYPVAEDLSKKGVNLPSGNTLTKEQVKYVANSIRSLKRGK
jgi:perosamine synthetase